VPSWSATRGPYRAASVPADKVHACAAASCDTRSLFLPFGTISRVSCETTAHTSTMRPASHACSLDTATHTSEPASMSCSEFSDKAVPMGQQSVVKLCGWPDRRPRVKSQKLTRPRVQRATCHCVDNETMSKAAGAVTR
jgi:hypothetical protein